MRRQWWKTAAGSFAAACLVILAACPARAQAIERWFNQFQPHAVLFQVDADATQPVEVSRFWIGLLARPVDDVLKSQLKLDQGLVVDRVVPDAPAAKAGVEQHDILLSYGDHQLGNIFDLVKAVKATADKPAEVKLIRGGKPKSLQVTPVERPEGGLDLKLGPAPDRDSVNRWLEEFVPQQLERGQLKLHRFQPGVVLPKTAEAQQKMPNNLSVTITKKGEEKAKISVSKDGKSWETTEDKLDVLPEDIRPHVKRLLGRRAVVQLDAKTFKWGPEEMKKLPQLQELWKGGVPPRIRVYPERNEQHVQQIERRMRQQLERMRRSLEDMQREIDGLHGRAPAGNVKEAEVVEQAEPEKPKKKPAKKADKE